MASGQCPQAKITIYGVDPSGAKKPLFKGVNEQTGPGGSPDGVQATTKANEIPFMPASGVVLPGGYKIVAYVTLKTADGIDASDCVLNIPILRNGALEYLSASELNFTTDHPAGTLANVETQLGSGYTIPENDRVQVGGGNYFISIENDTA